MSPYKEALFFKREPDLPLLPSLPGVRSLCASAEPQVLPRRGAGSEAAQRDLLFPVPPSPCLLRRATPAYLSVRTRHIQPSHRRKRFYSKTPVGRGGRVQGQQ